MRDELLPRVACAQAECDPAVQVAFTAEGLRAFGLKEAELGTFPQDFLEGMERRAPRLGDFEKDVACWQFGRAEQEVHLLVMLYAATADGVSRALEELRGRDGEALAAWGLSVVHTQRAAWSEREPFGFRDGLSQPAVSGLPETEGHRAHAEDTPVETGEFLLGYRNEYGELPISPNVPAERDPHGRLGPVDGDASRRDLGRNGTFMVVRKLRQDVKGFERFLGEQARAVYGVDDERYRKLLAAKMIGRWPNGAPLLPGQTEEPEIRPGEENAFLFLSPRTQGGCPFGAHVRRANPRDSLSSGGKWPEAEAKALGPRDPEALSEERKESLRSVRRHRLLRRALRYLEHSDSDSKEEGLLFIALNASIQRQFEYVHRSWLHNEKIGTASDEKDPLMSTGCGERFTIPDSPVRKVLKELPAFVHTRGGAYLFLPSLSALRFLAELPD